MRTPIWVAILLLSTSATATASTADIEFSEPTQVWGEPNLTSYAPTSIATTFEEGLVRLRVEAGTHVIETRRTDSAISIDNVASGKAPIVPTIQEYVVETPGWIEFQSISPTRDLAVLADFNRLNELPLQRASSMTWDDSKEFSDDAPHGLEFSREYRDQVQWFRDGVLVSTDERQPIQLDSSEVSVISWTNAKVVCHDVSPCPSSDEGETTNAGNAAWVHEYVNIQIINPAEISISSESAQTHFLSSSWSIAGNMAARLPQASGEDCQAIGCDGVRTIRLDGDFAMSDLSRSGDGRLSAQIHGNVQNLILDEQPIDPALLWSVGAGAVALSAVLLAVLSKLGLFGLFTRISPDKALEHPRRQILFEYIVENPGTTFREIVRNTGVPTGTTRHHLNVMRRSELVVEKPHKSTLRFFENHGKFDASWDTVVMLREPALAELHAWLMSHPESPQKDIVAAMESEGYSRGTTQHRLGRLHDAGLVTLRQQGRLKLYTAHDQPQRRLPRHDDWNGLDAAWPLIPHA